MDDEEGRDNELVGLFTPVVEAMQEMTEELIERRVAPLEARIAALEARLAALEGSERSVAET